MRKHRYRARCLYKRIWRVVSQTLRERLGEKTDRLPLVITRYFTVWGKGGCRTPKSGNAGLGITEKAARRLRCEKAHRRLRYEKRGSEARGILPPISLLLYILKRPEYPQFFLQPYITEQTTF